MAKQRKSLLAIMSITDDQARTMLEDIRWPKGATCIHCGSQSVTSLQGKSTRPGVYKCKDCRKQFTVTVGTIFERSHIPLRKWVIAFYMMITARKGVSALQLQRDLDLVSYESAWHMAHRLRLMMKTEQYASKMGGTVEIDEVYVGGKPRRYSAIPSKGGRGTRKAQVFVIVERNGSVRTAVVENVQKDTLQPLVRENVEETAIVNSDEWKAYIGLSDHFAEHKVVKHRIGQYVNGDAYTNTAESFNALVKRAHYGIYHYISKKHLHRYCVEFGYRWDHRYENHIDAVEHGLGMAEGKRLMYKTLVDENQC